MIGHEPLKLLPIHLPAHRTRVRPLKLIKTKIDGAGQGVDQTRVLGRKGC